MIGRFIATTMACALLAGAAAAEELSVRTNSHAVYLPGQSISHEFGSKFMSGYFLQESASCIVILMVTEANHTEEVLLTSPARLRVALRPGQYMGLDSEEGRSLNLRCSTNATMLHVVSGETENLLALWDATLRQTTAQRP